MHIVIFEVQPQAGQWDAYLNLAKDLNEQLRAIDGFLAVERFRSLRIQGRALSVSSWHNEAAIMSWRTQANHRRAQDLGRTRVFADYRLRVGEVAAEASSQAVGPQSFPELDSRKTVTLTELAATEASRLHGKLQQDAGALGNSSGFADCDLFESIYNAGKFMLLASFDSGRSARQFRPTEPFYRHCAVGIIRDYGMFDRRQAPRREMLASGSDPQPVAERH